LGRNIEYVLYNTPNLNEITTTHVSTTFICGVSSAKILVSAIASRNVVLQIRRKLYESFHACLLVLSKKIQFINDDVKVLMIKYMAKHPA
jgi:hypothetical protein